jgi:HAD superfamily hydrolase (TIGR01549 family)
MNHSPLLRALICDYDDTLRKTFDFGLLLHQEVAKNEYGINLAEEDVREVWGRPIEELYARLYQIDLENADEISRAGRIYQEYFDRAVRAKPIEIYPESISVLSSLKQHGVKLGLVTSCQRNMIGDDEQTKQLLALFDYMQCAEDSLARKPDPQVFDKISHYFREKYGILESETMYIGDELTDFYAANAAGVPFLGVETIHSAHEFNEYGADVVADIGALPSYFGLDYTEK